MVIFVIIILLIVVIILTSLLATFLWGAPWSPTPMRTVRRMLELAEVKNGERVYDLGTGDGRIAVLAAVEFGAKAVGVEINPFLYTLARIRKTLRRAGDAVQFVRGDFLKINLKDADVVAVYLSPWGNRKLRGKLARELKPGARVVTHKWRFRGWSPVKSDEHFQVWVYRMSPRRKGRS